MIKQTCVTNILCMIAFFCNGQEKIGFTFDAGGYALHGFYDPFSYQPTVSVSKNLGSYMPGGVYGIDGEKKACLLKFEQAKLTLKNKDGYTMGVSTDKYTGVKIGLDSFFVAEKIHFRGRTRERKTFVQFIAEFDSTVFAKIYNNNFNGSVLHQTYIAKRYDEETWEELNPTKKSLEPMIQKFFSKYSNVIATGNELDRKGVNYFSYLVGEYENNYKMNDANLGGLINLAYVTSRLGKNEKVYFDEFFRKTKNTDKSKYYSLIVSVNDQTYLEEYYTHEDEKVYSVNWRSKVNGEKDGESIFYDEGKKAIMTFYREDEVKFGEVYNADTVSYKFEYKENKAPLKLENYTNIYGYGRLKAYTPEEKYLSCVIDFLNGNDKKDQRSFIDPYDGRQKQVITKNQEVISATVEENNIVYSYLVDPLQALKVKKINKLFDKYFNDQFFINNTVFHPLLVKVNTDAEGKLIKYEFLNTVNKEFESVVSEFITVNLLDGGPKGKFKFKLRNTAINKPIEFILPFKLNISGQFWFFQNNSDWMMHQNMIWNQQHMHMMHQNTMNHIHSMAPTF